MAENNWKLQILLKEKSPKKIYFDFIYRRNLLQVLTHDYVLIPNN